MSLCSSIILSFDICWPKVSTAFGTCSPGASDKETEALVFPSSWNICVRAESKAQLSCLPGKVPAAFLLGLHCFSRGGRFPEWAVRSFWESQHVCYFVLFSDYIVHSLEEAISSILDERRAGCQQSGWHSLEPRHRKGLGPVCAEPHTVSDVPLFGRQFSESFLIHLCSQLSTFWTHLLSILQIHSHHQMLPKCRPWEGAVEPEGSPSTYGGWGVHASTTTWPLCSCWGMWTERPWGILWEFVTSFFTVLVIKMSWRLFSCFWWNLFVPLWKNKTPYL